MPFCVELSKYPHHDQRDLPVPHEAGSYIAPAIRPKLRRPMLSSLNVNNRQKPCMYNKLLPNMTAVCADKVQFLLQD